MPNGAGAASSNTTAVVTRAAVILPWENRHDASEQARSERARGEASRAAEAFVETAVAVARNIGLPTVPVITSRPTTLLV